MTPSVSATLVVAMLASPAVAAAQASSETLQATVKTGQTVSIVDENGREIEGRVEAISEHAVRLSVRKRSEEIPLDRIVRIERPDSLKNGALIGLAIGVTAGVTGGFLDAQGRDQRGAFVVVSTIGNGIIWTALGTGIDALIDRRRTLYQRGGRTQARLSPVLGRGVRGAALTLTW